MPYRKWTKSGDEYHKAILLSGSWLDDLLVSAMLKAQHPHLGGFQAPTLADKLAMVPQTGKFIQVLNINTNHWITISNVGCTTPFSVKVYDSLGGRLPTAAKKIIADLLQCSKKSTAVYYEDVQEQLGGNDCGCFSLAFATSLCATVMIHQRCNIIKQPCRG